MKNNTIYLPTVRKAKMFLEDKIINCHNTSTIFDTKDYVKYEDAIKALNYFENTIENYDKMLLGVDEEIRDLVDVLNKNGYPTIASCSGHGKMPGWIVLKNKREIMIIENYDKARKVEEILISEGLYEPINPRNNEL